MRLRIATFATVLYFLVVLRPVIVPLLITPVTYVTFVWVAWQAAFIIHRRVIQKQLFGPIDATGKAVLITGTRS